MKLLYKNDVQISLLVKPAAKDVIRGGAKPSDVVCHGTKSGILSRLLSRNSAVG